MRLRDQSELESFSAAPLFEVKDWSAGGCRKRFPLVRVGCTNDCRQCSVRAKESAAIDEIVLEGWQGQGTYGDPYGPGFKVSLRRNGIALFTGKAKVKLIGDFRGTISSAEFEKLVSFIVARKYDRIPEDPVNRTEFTPLAGGGRVPWYDGSPYMITSIVYEGGQTKTVFSPTLAQGIDLKHIPKDLFEIEQAVFDAATRIRWTKIK